MQPQQATGEKHDDGAAPGSSRVDQNVTILLQHADLKSPGPNHGRKQALVPLHCFAGRSAAVARPGYTATA